MSAAVYDYETGDAIAVGLQGSSVCDEAWQVACRIAAEIDAPVTLDDDDGQWTIYPDGHRTEAVSS